MWIYIPPIFKAFFTNPQTLTVLLWNCSNFTPWVKNLPHPRVSLRWFAWVPQYRTQLFITSVIDSCLYVLGLCLQLHFKFSESNSLLFTENFLYSLSNWQMTTLRSCAYISSFFCTLFTGVKLWELWNMDLFCKLQRKQCIQNVISHFYLPHSIIWSGSVPTALSPKAEGSSSRTGTLFTWKPGAH